MVMHDMDERVMRSYGVLLGLAALVVFFGKRRIILIDALLWLDAGGRGKGKSKIGLTSLTHSLTRWILP